MSSQSFLPSLLSNKSSTPPKKPKITEKSLQAQRSSMADFSSHHSLLLKMPAALTNNSPNLPGLLFTARVMGAKQHQQVRMKHQEEEPPWQRTPHWRAPLQLLTILHKDCKEAKSKRGKRSSKEAEEKSTTEDEAHKGYIHVRARRGQATDSHSLAERVRRERISERMRMLQALVPGCDKVSGKALILDEIINYVQSLQNQVEVDHISNKY
ncbi:hypothetical protein PR202_gb02529 [Eleusine coracana subsp. coracana]|uniref:BHLH domain-containing protein n=1 Tax=Eleusine coracana subsp. coracana TaxID=191504 RepID=A0AAV5DYS9_ELECO|nr:hypothetical protein PR202_gb02529 [Eleusine coracana subsp. coracana]